MSLSKASFGTIKQTYDWHAILLRGGSTHLNGESSKTTAKNNKNSTINSAKKIKQYKLTILSGKQKMNF